MAFILHPGPHLLQRCTPSRLEALKHGVLGLPLLQPPLPEKVLIVQSQFLQAGAGHVGELEFSLLRGAAGLAALGDVLHARTRRLHHLIVGAAALLDVAIAETHRHVVHQLRHLETLQLPVAAVPWNQSLRLRHRSVISSLAFTRLGLFAGHSPHDSRLLGRPAHAPRKG